jgi:hypothetical protein
MKAKFFLALLALNGLIFSTSSASANSVSIAENYHDIANLSRIISELVKFDPDTHSLVEMAISRALIAQKTGDVPAPQSQLAGGISVPNFGSDRQPQPIVNGKIANPNPPTTQPKVKPVVKPPQSESDRYGKLNQQPSEKIDLPAAKKLEECIAPIDNSSNPTRSQVPLDQIAKPANRVETPAPIPPVRHFIGARG